MEKTRTDLLNHLAGRYKLNRYLEIGLQNAENNFDKIICKIKVSVDPDSNAKAKFTMTSDEYFEEINKIQSLSASIHKDILNSSLQFDLIFIDGMHTAEQVQKDFENSLKVLSPNGFIVLHDCNPEKEEYTHVPRDSKVWNGDVYKFASTLRSPNFFTVNIDHGCGVFWGGPDYYLSQPPVTSWDVFDKNRWKYINLVPWEFFLE